MYFEAVFFCRTEEMEHKEGSSMVMETLTLFEAAMVQDESKWEDPELLPALGSCCGSSFSSDSSFTVTWIQISVPSLCCGSHENEIQVPSPERCPKHRPNLNGPEAQAVNSPKKYCLGYHHFPRLP